MLHVDLPTDADLAHLADHRGDICVSIALPTTPLSQQTAGDRIELGNLAREAQRQLEAAGADKRQVAALLEHLDDLREDDEFWRLQARSLVAFATPTTLRTFRLPSTLQIGVEVSDRFHLKPLLRAIAFPNTAHVLALSENLVRVVEVSADLPPVTVKLDGIPKGAADSVGKASINDRSPTGRIQGSEGKKVRLRQFVRQVDQALRPLLAGSAVPLILATAHTLDPIYRSVNSYPLLAAGMIEGNPEALSDLELADRARTILDGLYRDRLAAWRELFDTRAGQGRSTTDIAQAARAATFGAIDTLLVDIDRAVPGTIDPETGVVAFAEASSADTYGVVDEIARRTLQARGHVLAVRAEDIPEQAALAAILRYPV
ncbi:MAG: hypothetical protein AB7I59_16535 [Geminicoccaceae bacterium]